LQSIYDILTIASLNHNLLTSYLCKFPSERFESRYSCCCCTLEWISWSGTGCDDRRKGWGREREKDKERERRLKKKRNKEKAQILTWQM
jgi:hypothetical protein